MSNRNERRKDIKAGKRVTGGVIAILLAVCVVMLGFVAVNAYNTTLQYEINNINKDIQAVQREIQTLEVQIKSASNITNIEVKAVELGLIYPNFENTVHLNSQDAEIKEFALALMESVYNR